MSVVISWIHAAADRAHDRVAIEGLERSLTYAELRDAAVAGAGALRGVRRVAIVLPPGEDFVVALHACMLAGAAAVPIDLRLSEAEREQRLAGADVMIDSPIAASTRLAGQPARLDGGVGSERAGDVPVAVMHTSGTTAAPKPVMLTHGNFLASALGSAVALGLDPRSDGCVRCR